MPQLTVFGYFLIEHNCCISLGREEKGEETTLPVGIELDIELRIIVASTNPEYCIQLV